MQKWINTEMINDSMNEIHKRQKTKRMQLEDFLENLNHSEDVMKVTIYGKENNMLKID